MAEKEYTLNVRYRTKDPATFETIEKVMARAAADIHALLMVAQGSGQKPPTIRLFTDDFVLSGEQEIDFRKVAEASNAEQKPEDSAAFGDDTVV